MGIDPDYGPGLRVRAVIDSTTLDIALRVEPVLELVAHPEPDAGGVAELMIPGNADGRFGSGQRAGGRSFRASDRPE